MPELSEEQREGLLRWWYGLDQNRADRAHLRHASHPDEIVLSDAFARFEEKAMLPDAPAERLCYAAVAGLLAHVYEWSSDDLCQQMAGQTASGRERAVSESRLQRLLRTETLGDLYEQLRRVLDLLGPRPATNIVRLADDVLHWGPAVQQRWADDYYAELFSSEAAPPAALHPFRAKWNDETKDWEKTLDICAVWWSTLGERRAERAALRRCTGPAEVHLTPGFQRLRAWLRKAELNTYNRDNLAATAGLLAHIKTHLQHPEQEQPFTFPRRLAGAHLYRKSEKSKAEVRYPEHPTLSGLRFRRLLTIEDDAERYRALIRSIRLIDGQLDVHRFMEDLLYWKDDGPDSTLLKWAEAYYTAVPAAT